MRKLFRLIRNVFIFIIVLGVIGSILPDNDSNSPVQNKQDYRSESIKSSPAISPTIELNSGNRAISESEQPSQTSVSDIGNDEKITKTKDNKGTDVEENSTLGSIPNTEIDSSVGGSAPSISSDAQENLTDAENHPKSYYKTKGDSGTAGESDGDKKKVVSTIDSFSVVQRGDKGDSVKEVQEMLVNLGFLSSAVDGSYGPKTEQAVTDFQQAAGIEVTGIIDEKTYNILSSDNAPEKKAEASPIVEIIPDENASVSNNITRNSGEQMVWIPTHGGKRFHSKSSCSGMDNPEHVTRSEAEALGFTPCGRCRP